MTSLNPTKVGKSWRPTFSGNGKGRTGHDPFKLSRLSCNRQGFSTPCMPVPLSPWHIRWLVRWGRLGRVSLRRDWKKSGVLMNQVIREVDKEIGIHGVKCTSGTNGTPSTTQTTKYTLGSVLPLALLASTNQYFVYQPHIKLPSLILLVVGLEHPSRSTNFGQVVAQLTWSCAFVIPSGTYLWKLVFNLHFCALTIKSALEGLLLFTVIRSQISRHPYPVVVTYCQGSHGRLSS